MSVEMRQHMLQEAAIAARFTEIYRRQFAALIERMNSNLGDAPDRDGLRLCIEAVDMMLATQSYLTQAIAQLGSSAEPQLRAAA